MDGSRSHAPELPIARVAEAPSSSRAVEQPVQAAARSVNELLTQLDKRLDLKAFMSDRRQFFRPGEAFKQTTEIRVADTLYLVELTSASEDKYQPVITLKTAGENGQKVVKRYEFTGRFKQGVDRMLGGLPATEEVEETAAEDHTSPRTQVSRLQGVQTREAFEAFLHQPTGKIFYAVKAGGKMLYKITLTSQPHQARTYQVQGFNVEAGTWNKTAQRHTTFLNQTADASFDFISAEDGKRLIAEKGGVRAEVVATLPKEPTIEDVDLLRAPDLASAISSETTLKAWRGLLFAIQNKKNSDSYLEAQGIRMVVTEEGGKKKLRVEASKNHVLFRAMLAEKKAWQEGSKTQLLKLKKFIVAHGLSGFSFGFTKVEEPPGDSSSAGGDSGKKGGGFGARDLAGFSLGGGGGGTPKPPEMSVEAKEQACIEAFLFKFNQEVLRDIRSGLMRQNRDTGNKALLEEATYYLGEADLHILREDGQVLMALSADGKAKVRDLWLNTSFGKGEEIEQQWYIFKANLESFVAEQAEQGIDLDAAALIENIESILEPES